MDLRLGDILVSRGVLSEAQKHEALVYQADRAEPFGSICERLFNIEPSEIEEAWAVQYVELTRKVDPRNEVYEDAALELITRRQAWQFRVLPIRFDEHDLMICTTAQHVRRALRFATNFLPVPVYMVIADPLPLGEAMCARYPIAGMTPSSVNDDAMDRLLDLVRSG